jgi:hypothetical protein
VNYGNHEARVIAAGARHLSDGRSPNEVLGLHAEDNRFSFAGRHSDEVLAELGYKPEEIAKLHDAKVI